MITLNLFIPDVAYVDPKSLKYSSGIRTLEFLESHNVPIINSRLVSIEGKSPIEKYAKAKRTVLITGSLAYVSPRLIISFLYQVHVPVIANTVIFKLPRAKNPL